MKNLLYDKASTLKLEETLKKKGISSLLLMTRAGFNIYQLIKNKIKYDQIIVLAGPGSNGGDAIAFAIHAKINNENVSCLSLSNHKNNSKKLYNFSKQIGLEFKKYKKNLFVSKKKLLIVEGILGIGISREPSGLISKIISDLNTSSARSNKTVVSIDIPAGLNPDNGVAYANTVIADYTIMCLTKKQGCYTGDGLKHSGKLYFTNLSVGNVEKIHSTKNILLESEEREFLYRNKLGHKGNFGNVLILGGWDNMPGAANLASQAALRSGCGKVFICTNNYDNLPDEIIRVEPNLNSIQKIIGKINVIIAGPGLGNRANDILKYFWKTKLPIIFDADALNWLSRNFKTKRKALLIGTPHYGEAKSLLRKDFKDRFLAIKKIKEKYGGRWVLKGPGTLILNSKLYVNNFANSILATAGSGDVLAGIIGGLVAQNIKNPEIIAVKIQSFAAKKLLKQQNKTMLASDLLEEISKSIYTN